MIKIKKIYYVLLFIVGLLLVPNNSYATEKEDLIYKIAPDGENAVVKAYRPSSSEDEEFILTGYFNKKLNEPDYFVTAGCVENPDRVCNLTITSSDYESNWDSELGQEVVLSGWRQEYNINVTYEEPEDNDLVLGYKDKLNNFDSEKFNTYYRVEDLSLINYYLSSDKSELWNNGAPARALKFSTINNVTKNSDISYFLDLRAGVEPTGMFELAFGEMSVFYKDYLYFTKTEGIYLNRIIYIPEDTENTKEAYINAAQKRINDYLGNEDVVVTYGGQLSSLDEEQIDSNHMVESDGNYYNISIGNRTYKFYIVKDDTMLEEPTYHATNIEYDFDISSNSSLIPLDTSINVLDVTENQDKELLRTNNYKAYDITLYSDSKQSKIEKIDTNFDVKIPIPDSLKDKDVVVYYIKEDGSLETYNPEPKEGYLEFETNHFSTYVVAESAACTQIVNDNSTYEKATLTSDGVAHIFKEIVCDETGTTNATIKYDQIIYHPNKYVLSKSVYNYNGNVKRPSVKIYTSNNKLINASNYTVTYSNYNSKKVGQYKITITFKGNYYTGKKVLTYKIVPKTVKLKKVQSLKKSFKATWTKNTTQTQGYQLIYSTDKKFKKNYKKVTIKNNKTLTKTIKKLKSKKVYYVSVRTYKTINKINYFSEWSNIIKVKTK